MDTESILMVVRWEAGCGRMSEEVSRIRSTNK